MAASGSPHNAICCSECGIRVDGMTRKNGGIIPSDTALDVGGMENKGSAGPSIDLANVAG